MSVLTRIRRRIDKWFPYREVLVRSNDAVIQLRFGKFKQLALTIIGAMVLTWTVGVTGYSWYMDQRLSLREEQLFRSELAYNELINRVTESQRRFGEITTQIEGTHRNLLQMAETNQRLQARVQDFSVKLADSEKEKVRISVLRTSMDNQMGALQQQIDGITNRNLALRDELETVETVMSRVMRERDQAVERSKNLQRDLADARQRIVDLHTVQKQAMERVAEHADSSISELESVLKMTGLPVESLLGDSFDDVSPPGVGGPFIEFRPETPEDEVFLNAALAVGSRMNQLASLQNVIKRMPLGDPADTYYVSSLFGKRKDPFNNKWAYHSGVDLAAPLKTPIYSTGPGKVTFAGWSETYGKMVDIDHGGGITTRYAHLNKILVKKGQDLNYRDKIALMGTSGRSTGSHVHYEVLVNGKEVDPIKFIEAGRYVFKAEQNNTDN
ncbi:M23 family metallopeptidase [Thalassospira sp.]|uniref:M23 family metallopeptidase n=1 Tax=Thalassospira sp. TaxID=1912094 RepID=UPI00273288D2|nr:M23 family metallopeptidase [Thalassospira sp.]MDP2697815.1 peptidoglycan DD-metalloendopeptidase family protein [Thalassospira sp.]